MVSRCGGEKHYACKRSSRKSRIYLHVALPINNESEVDVEIHRVAACSHTAQLNRDSGRISDPAVVGAHIDVCYVVDAVADFDDISVAYRIVSVADVEVIPCRYPSAFSLTPASTTFQDRFIGAVILINTEDVPVSISLPVPANPTPLPSPGPPEFVIDPELFV